MKASKWGSLLGSAVANLESRLDTILAEDGPNSKPPGIVKPSSAPRRSDSVRSNAGVRASSKTRVSSDGQRLSSPRPSVDIQRNVGVNVPELQVEEVPKEAAESTGQGIAPNIEEEAIGRPSTESTITIADTVEHDEQEPASAMTSVSTASTTEYQAQLAQLQADNQAQEVQRQDEVHNYLERIDALQAKLQYLTSESANNARSAAESAPADSLEKKLAAKDEQIALLLEEGQKLSKAEVTQSTVLRKLRAKAADDGRIIAELRRKLAIAEKTVAESKEVQSRLEHSTKEASIKVMRLVRAEREIDDLKKNRDSHASTIESLKAQLETVASKVRAEEKEASAKALESERKVSQSLMDDLTSAKLEKQLSDDKRKFEVSLFEEEKQRIREQHAAQEATLHAEISNLESRVEVLRGRSEEVSSASLGDNQAKLLRQIELLQSQYSQASENWQGIETSLQARLAAVERERDDASKQESDTRKKAREAGSASRRLQEELDNTARKCGVLEADMAERQAAATRLQTRVASFETSLKEAREAHEREKLGWESSMNARIEEEKVKWRQEFALEPPTPLSRVESPSYPTKRPQGLEIPGLANRRSLSRNASQDLGLPMYTRRSSVMPLRTPDLQTNGFDSGRSTPPIFPIPETPSIRMPDGDDMFDTVSSAHHTVNDMISESTTGAGPSVQLVERMSAAVRRLESEKAASKDEMARVMAQRNDLRKEIVVLMKEVEAKRAVDQKVEKVEKENEEVKKRYEATLEMLGEKSEQVEELRADVADLKGMYRELVERTLK